jgi:hypothetical protein
MVTELEKRAEAKTLMGREKCMLMVLVNVLGDANGVRVNLKG